jgi:hypothetical protein
MFEYYGLCMKLCYFCEICVVLCPLYETMVFLGHFVCPLKSPFRQPDCYCCVNAIEQPSRLLLQTWHIMKQAETAKALSNQWNIIKQAETAKAKCSIQFTFFKENITGLRNLIISKYHKP